MAGPQREPSTSELNQARLDAAQRLLVDTAMDLIQRRAHGSVTIELNVKDGSLTRPKRVCIDFVG